MYHWEILCQWNTLTNVCSFSVIIQRMIYLFIYEKLGVTQARVHYQTALINVCVRVCTVNCRCHFDEDIHKLHVDIVCI